MKHRAMMPAFVLALFDGEAEGGEGGQSTQNNGGGEGGKSTTTGAGGKTAEPTRDSGGRYASIEQAEQRIADLNKENADRRKENSGLKKSVDSIARRTLRSEAKAALMEAGALHPDVVEIFLKAAGDKVKLNDDFDVVGLSESLDAFKQSHKPFFKTDGESTTEDDKSKDESKDDDKSGDGKDGKKDQKKNATGSGASTQGGGTENGDANRGLPDLRGLKPEERRKALDAYKRGFGRS